MGETGPQVSSPADKGGGPEGVPLAQGHTPESVSKWEEDPGLLSVFSLFFHTCLWSPKLSDQFLDLMALFTLGELSVWLWGPQGTCQLGLQEDGVLPMPPLGGQEKGPGAGSEGL